MKVIDRDKTELPDYIVPGARVAIADKALLRRAAAYRSVRHPRRWYQDNEGDVFVEELNEPGRGCDLLVRRIGSSNCWTVERLALKRKYQWEDEILMDQFGLIVVVAESAEQAKQLAVYCHENGPPPKFTWGRTCPA